MNVNSCVWMLQHKKWHNLALIPMINHSSLPTKEISFFFFFSSFIIILITKIICCCCCSLLLWWLLWWWQAGRHLRRREIVFFFLHACRVLWNLVNLSCFSSGNCLRHGKDSFLLRHGSSNWLKEKKIEQSCNQHAVYVFKLGLSLHESLKFIKSAIISFFID